MPKENFLDRLAGAMKTLNKRRAKNLTPRQRVAAAQRWNSLADAGEYAEERIWDSGGSDEATSFVQGMRNLGLKSNGWDTRADNPFLSDNIDKYQEQSEFLDWCRYNHIEPSGRALKQFRTEKIYDAVEAGDLGAGDAVIQVFNSAGGFSPETGYDALESLHSRMDAGNIGVFDAMDEAYLRGLRVARKRRGW